MQKYSIFNLVKNAFSNHENWDLAWKDPTPKEEYDVVIIGGGGHGLATAYYLAKEHNITKVAIVSYCMLNSIRLEHYDVATVSDCNIIMLQSYTIASL